MLKGCLLVCVCLPTVFRGCERLSRKSVEWTGTDVAKVKYVATLAALAVEKAAESVPGADRCESR